MTAGLYDIALEQGADFSLSITWKSGGAVVDLTGYTAQMMVRQSYLSPTALISLSSPAGGIALGGVLGTIAISIPAAEVDNLIPNLLAYYDLKLTSGGGKTTRLLQGRVTDSAAITK